ncbi:hypothetical protein BFS14_01830 [Serratia fonticola]|uniref:hypothetical protein n=1 Tax=Serratia fonticola TaxID=47917 RepID=UPI0008FD5F0E|nr:hypothetical protein [Serratia fonticola]OIX96229.1 hypothetical protein BFS14_01830 [Serratia fonticola]QCR60850.1 hypothetical protein FD644_10945 [Serratia fonticola]
MALKPSKEVRTPLYSVRVGIYSSAEAAGKVYGDGFFSKNFGAQVCRVENIRTGVDMVTITFRSPASYNAESLTHECIHAAWRILELVGIKVSVDNQEPLAYLAGWLSREVNNFMVPHAEAMKDKPE